MHQSPPQGHSLPKSQGKSSQRQNRKTSDTGLYLTCLRGTLSASTHYKSRVTGFKFEGHRKTRDKEGTAAGIRSISSFATTCRLHFEIRCVAGSASFKRNKTMYCGLVRCFVMCCSRTRRDSLLWFTSSFSFFLFTCFSPCDVFFSCVFSSSILCDRYLNKEKERKRRM